MSVDFRKAGQVAFVVFSSAAGGAVVLGCVPVE